MDDTAYYFITKKCTECGACLDVCTQKAIQADSPYSINAASCDACGRCRDVCTAGAIILENDPYHLINREWDSFFGGGCWQIGRKWWER